MRVGRPQEVASGQEDTIQYRFLVDGLPQTPDTTPTVKIESPSGAVLLAATSTGVSYSSETISYTRTWETADYPATRGLADALPEAAPPKVNRNFGFRATWTITYGGNIYTRYTYFEPVLRHFRSQVLDSDLTELYPQLKDQLDDPTSGTFRAWRNKAWDDIARRVERETGRHPGDTFSPEEFFECHRQWTLKVFFLTIARRDGDIFWERFKEAKAEAEREYRLVVGQMAMDENRDSQYIPQETKRRRWQGIGR